jgi:outer membrane receptor protein involved in Fe transport
VNAGITYRSGNWAGALKVMNLLDEDYIAAAGSRGAVTVGTPMDWKVSVTYKF